VVWVDFKILMRDALFVQGYPGSLHEGTEPAAVEDQRVWGGVCVCEFGGATRGVFVDRGVDAAHFECGGSGGTEWAC